MRLLGVPFPFPGGGDGRHGPSSEFAQMCFQQGTAGPRVSVVPFPVAARQCSEVQAHTQGNIIKPSLPSPRLTWERPSFRFLHKGADLVRSWENRVRKNNFPKHETTVLFNGNHIFPLNYGTWGSLCEGQEVTKVSSGRGWGAVVDIVAHLGSHLLGFLGFVEYIWPQWNVRSLLEKQPWK